MHALDYIWELDLLNRHKHTVWPDHCIAGKENYSQTDADARWLDISTRDANFRVINASRGNEVVHSLHAAIEVWKAHWLTKSIKKSVKTIDIGMCPSLGCSVSITANVLG
jgi:hypothetical protein